MSRNQDVANLLYQIAKILEVQGVAFKPRAYQRAALNIETLGDDIERVVAEDRLPDIPGVGSAIAEKVKEYLTTGRLEYLEKLRTEVPDGLLGLMTIPGIGPKTALKLWTELKITSLDELKAAVKDHRLQDVKGFGEKSEQEILRAIGDTAQQHERVSLFDAHLGADRLTTWMVKHAGRRRMVFAGSYRRGRDTVGDLDLLVEATRDQAPRAIDAFVRYPLVKDVLEQGTTRSRIVLRGGLHVDLRVVAPESFGAAMLYFTGSKEHNIAVRALALKKGWTLNEYALSNKKDGSRVAGATEEEIYDRLGLQFVPPEIRENRGEIEQAAAKKLPALVELKDLRGDLHTHTKESDGGASLKAMVQAAAKRGYDYFGISDHSQALRITNGLDGVRFRRQRKAIDGLADEAGRMRLLQGCELEILKDGTLDLTPEVRASLDYVAGAVHSAFKLSKKEQTDRVLKAMDAGIDILAHPTCRRILKRPSIEVDLEAVASKAKERGILLEVDATPDRFDLWGEMIAVCLDVGASFVIDSDAHSVSELDYMPFGVTQARRGGLEASDVANTKPLASLMKSFGHAKRG